MPNTHIINGTIQVSLFKQTPLRFAVFFEKCAVWGLCTVNMGPALGPPKPERNNVTVVK